MLKGTRPDEPIKKAIIDRREARTGPPHPTRCLKSKKKKGKESLSHNEAVEKQGGERKRRRERGERKSKRERGGRG